MSVIVKAKTGDSLCAIAIAAGFINCDALRAEGANSAFLNRPLQDGDKVTVPKLRPKDIPKGVDGKHKFVKKNCPVGVRFVHGSKDKKYLEDTTLKVLNVSNFRTDMGGVAEDQPFPAGFGFNPDGDVDIDTFKVEVEDPRAGGTVKVKLEALKPVKQADGSVLFQPLTGVTDEGLRKIDALDCKQVASGNIAFRSKYMRLVVDKDDQAAANGQTLLTTDTVDSGDEDLEILGQHVRATYVFPRCKAAPKCQATAELPVGENRLRARVRVHIMQDPATGTGLATVDQARKSVLKYVRQLYAQANMSVKIVDTIRIVPAPTNLIAIANGNGGPATGGTIRVRVQIGKINSAVVDFDKTVQVVTTAGDLPSKTADALQNAINAAFAAATPPFAAKAKSSPNPPLDGQAIGSADVVVGDPLTQSITLSVVTSGDPGHPVLIGRILTSNVPDFVNADSHVGTIEERTLVKNYDTGTNHIDLFIIGTLGSGALGEAFTPNASKPAKQPTTLMVDSALVFAATITTADNFHTTVPHEMGHILMDDNHAIPAIEMMGAGSPVGANERVVQGPKRISDANVAYDSGTNDNAVTMLRTHNTGLTEAF